MLRKVQKGPVSLFVIAGDTGPKICEANFGQVPKWPNGTDCKSVVSRLRRFESFPAHQFCQQNILGSKTVPSPSLRLFFELAVRDEGQRHLTINEQGRFSLATKREQWPLGMKFHREIAGKFRILPCPPLR